MYPELHQPFNINKTIVMLIIPTEFIKGSLNLSLHSTLQEKIKSIIAYTNVNTVFCEIENPDDYDSPKPRKRLQVQYVAVPGGSPSYLKEILKESQHIITKEIQQLLHGSVDYDTISVCLQDCIQICETEIKQNDNSNRFTFKEDVAFIVQHRKGYNPVLLENLIFSQSAAFDLREHFDIRKYFFEELKKELTDGLTWHQKKTEPSLHPYSWDSAHPQLEITELIYLLYQKAEMIKINSAAGGSFSKFRKEFFGLFGLKDTRYDANVSDILKRKKGESFASKLASFKPNG